MPVHNRSERQIYCRHKVRCKNAAHKDEKGRSFPAKRDVFGCGCPIYGRLTITHPDTNEVLCKFADGSLSRYNITTREFAEELFNRWTMAALNGRETPNEANRQLKKIKQACDYFLSELRTNMEGKLKPWHVGIKKKKKTDRPTVKKYKVLLDKL